MILKVKRFSGSYILAIFVILAFYSSTVFSAVPEIINYQGSLSDNGGNPVNATLNITFTLYDVDAGPGTTLWQEVQVVTVTNGQFSVQLGADGGNPLPAPLDDPLFLGVKVDADAEMTPRQKFTSSAFALKAKTVENDTLNSLSCAADEIPKFNGSVWVCAVDDSNTGDITGVIAGNGLKEGGLSGDVNIAVDTNVVQNRVDGTCAVGSSIRAIAADGTVTCEVDTDTNTTYSAGSGLVLSGTTFAIPTDGVNASHLGNEAGANGIFTFVSISLPLATDVVVQSIDLIAPSSGHVVVNASASFLGMADTLNRVTCSLTRNSTALGTIDMYYDFDELQSGTSLTEFFANVPPGVSTYRLICRASTTNTSARTRHLNAIFVPTRY